jgi:hypothetical protein
MSSTYLQVPSATLPSTSSRKTKAEPQSALRASGYSHIKIKIESPSTPTSHIKVEAPQTPTPHIKIEPQTTLRLSSIPHGLPHLSPQRTLKVSSTPHTRTHLAPKPTQDISSSPLSPYLSSLFSRSKSPLKCVSNKPVFKNTRQYRQTRGGMKTPTIPRAEPRRAIIG